MPKRNKTKSVGDKTYQHSDYYRNEQTSKGMAETHEQVSDAYMEGTIGEGANSLDEKLPRE
ncbi:YozQ family protein [Oceanobacillus sp. Castelsardo]|uniref:YozQ family protein n=1 Tax=Oceanobacillus sp. Castelsardo TaxID=1851204 RepID=UPI000837C6E1|nr:YozQ family protein [Oceanobacillus sp. Castelsardo]